MGKILFIIIALIFVVQILKSSGSNKVIWFLTGILFFPSSIVLFEYPLVMSFPRLLTFTFFFAVFFQPGSWIDRYKKFPLHICLSFLLVMLLGIGFFDSRINLIQKLYRPLSYFFENFLIIFLCYSCVTKIEEVVRIYKCILVAFLIFTLYGISNYITKSNEYYSFIAETYGIRDFANNNMSNLVERFRISSFAWHAIYYGFLVSTAIFVGAFTLIFVKLKLKYKVLCFFILLLLFVNLFLVNSRTPILSLIAGLVLFVGFGLNLKNKLRIVISCFLLLFFIGTSIPSSTKIVTDTIDTFSSSGSELEGSSVEMRTLQMAASLAVFNQDPITGNGFFYIIEDMGYSSKSENRKSDDDFQGFESYSYKLLIEQGLFGIAGNAFFFISLFIFLYKKVKVLSHIGKKLAVLSIAILVSFLLFIFGTGDLGSFPFFMVIMGINIRGIDLLGEYKKVNRC